MANSYSPIPATKTVAPDQSQSEFIRLQMLWNKQMDMHVKPVKHDGTFVLCLSWDEKNTDMPCGKEVSLLMELLKNEYNFTVVDEKINTATRPQYQISKILGKFMEMYDQKHHLLIIYYAGHGWSETETGSFKLLNSTTQQEVHIAKRHAIAWQKAETIIQDTDADVLVIFDCCHAGALGKVRSSGRCFEFLGACDAEGTTRQPGDNSFTTALIWALKQLASDKETKYFPTSTLQEKITEAPNFPKGQMPVLFHRFEPAGAHITIAPMPRPGLSNGAGAYREDVDNLLSVDCLDLRFHYSSRLTDDEVKRTCEALSRLIKDDLMSAKRISFKAKVSPADEVLSRWREGVREGARKRGSSGGTPSVRGEQPPALNTNTQTYLEIPVVLTPADDSPAFSNSPVFASGEQGPHLENGETHSRKRRKAF